MKRGKVSLWMGREIIQMTCLWGLIGRSRVPCVNYGIRRWDTLSKGLGIGDGLECSRNSKGGDVTERHSVKDFW